MSWWDLQAEEQFNMANLSLKLLFESQKGELEQNLAGMKLPQDTTKIQQIIADYLNKLCDSDGEFRQNLTQAEDYILQAALSLLNAQQEMCSALVKPGMDFMQKELKKKTLSISESKSSSYKETNKSIIDTKLTTAQALIGSTGGALVGQVLLSGWGSVFGAIAGTAIAVYVASRIKHNTDTIDHTISKNSKSDIESQDVTLDIDEFIAIISGICDSVDHLIDTFRAQINRVISKYESQDKPAFEKNYRPLLENIQSLIGYSRTHGEDEKFAKKVGERIEDLADMLDTYHLSVIDYSEENDAWFEKVSSPNTTQPRMAYPAIVKEGEVIILGKIFIPEN